MNKQHIMTWIYRCASVLLAVSYCLVIVTLGRLGVLPGLFFLSFIIITAPIVLWVSLRIFRHDTNTKKRKLFTGLAIVLSVASIYMFATLYATATFLEGLDKSQISFETYAVVAKKERKISLTTAKSAVLIREDANKQNLVEELKKITSAAPFPVDTFSAVTTSLDSGNNEMGVISEPRIQILKEVDPTLYESLEVLATFKIRSNDPPTPSTIDTTKPFILYISGVDTYGQINAAARSDVNMLVVVNPREHKILLVNTPRDYYVTLHGTTGLRDKLTHAGMYGVDMSVRTMEDLYSISIDSYARVNFSSLISVVDTLGGIQVYSDYTFKTFRHGYNNLSGTQALEFSRERYSFTEGDKTRGKNQQRVIEAIIQKLQSPTVLTNYTSLLSNLSASLETNIGGATLTGLVNKQLEKFQSWTSESISVDGTGKLASTYSMGATPLYVMEPDATSLAAAKQKIAQYLTK